jgi:hypothetical protein
MSEQDFRDALRKTMDAVSPPPQMSDATVLAAAHRDRRRRRTLWASLGTAVVVAAIAVGVVLVAPSKSDGDGVRVGGPQPTSTKDVATPETTSSASEETGPGGSSETFPSGMTDRTAKSGPHYERGAALTAALDDVLANTGYGTPGDLENVGQLSGPLKRNQANYDGKVDGAEKWSYTAVTPATKGNGTGEMMTEVTTMSGQETGCALPKMWGLEGQCREITVDGKKVAFVDADQARRDHIDQFAAYRHDDGTLVYVTQSVDYAFSDLPPLAALPFTPEQLAAMAVDERFKVID